MIEPQGTLKKAPKSYKISPEKLSELPQRVFALVMCDTMYFSEDYKYFDVIRPYLDIPPEPKSLEELKQEFDEKIDKLIETTKEKFEYSKVVAEKRYKYEFDKIFERFEYAKDNGHFPYLNLSYTTTGLSAGSYGTSFVIKQGNTHKGYYTIGNQRYLRYYMPDKPNRLVRFFMKTCLGFYWVDDEL